MDSPISFLLVEDEERVRRMLVRSLGEHGAVDAVGTCAGARMRLRANTYDALIVDVKLPDGSGLDLIDIARKRSPAIYVLVLTGSTDHEVISRALEKGAYYLLKPCDAAHLAVVAAEIKSRHTAAERRTKVTLERWSKDYKLSQIEVELLLLGAQGVPREQIASLRRVLPETLRKQIQTLLQKTGDSSFEGAVNSLLREAVAEPT